METIIQYKYKYKTKYNAPMFISARARSNISTVSPMQVGHLSCKLHDAKQGGNHVSTAVIQAACRLLVPTDLLCVAQGEQGLCCCSLAEKAFSINVLQKRDATLETDTWVDGAFCSQKPNSLAQVMNSVWKLELYVIFQGNLILIREKKQTNICSVSLFAFLLLLLAKPRHSKTDANICRK